MALKYFVAGTQSPNDYYRDLAQAFIDQQWTNGAALAPEHGGPIKEQEDIGSSVYNEIEAWVKNTVGDVTTGYRSSGDFIKIYFRDINHTVKRGLYYFFADNYWIANDFGHFSGIAQDVGLRRCNNQLRIFDYVNNQVFSIPCVVDYNMQSPNMSTNRYVNTPNNHATVMVQGNDDTIRLFKLNTRYILDGRPFKLLAWQNSVHLDLSTGYDTLIYLDLYLDEEHPGDDLATGLADNSSEDYSNDDDMQKILDNAENFGGC